MSRLPGGRSLAWRREILRIGVISSVVLGILSDPPGKPLGKRRRDHGKVKGSMLKMLWPSGSERRVGRQWRNINEFLD
jgi:hypothetical protein